MLGIIEKDHPQDVMGCCKRMFQYWLDTRPDASWNQLLEALRSPCVQLNSLAKQIEHKLLKQCKSSFCMQYWSHMAQIKALRMEIISHVHT